MKIKNFLSIFSGMEIVRELCSVKDSMNFSRVSGSSYAGGCCGYSSINGDGGGVGGYISALVDTFPSASELDVLEVDCPPIVVVKVNTKASNCGVGGV